jgi:hypothetical protein
MLLLLLDLLQEREKFFKKWLRQLALSSAIGLSPSAKGDRDSRPIPNTTEIVPNAPNRIFTRLQPQLSLSLLEGTGIKSDFDDYFFTELVLSVCDQALKKSQ